MVVAPYPWQTEAAKTLNAMVDELPNAILLHGGEGTGAFELARAFAESLLCESPRMDGTPCGECMGCTLVKAMTHPDLRYVLSEAFAAQASLPYTPAEHESSDRKRRSREIRIHQIRDLSDFVVNTSHRGGRRLVLIYPADKLGDEAAASLLKTLEEPSRGLHFLLVADDIDGVLPTIRSRARLLRLTRPKRDEALAWLKTQKVKNAEIALAHAGGSPLSAVEPPEGMLSDKVAAGVLGLLKNPHFDVTTLYAAYSADVTPVGLSPLLSRWTVDLIRAKNGVEPYYYIDEAETLRALANEVTLEALFAYHDDLLAMARVADHPLFAQQVFEDKLLAYQALFER